MFEYMNGPEEEDDRAPAREKVFAYARERLLRRPPEETARDAAVTFDEGAPAFRFTSLGRPITVEIPSCNVSFSDTGRRPLWTWRAITLHYLAEADGATPSQEPLPFRRMKGGLIRGSGFENDCARTAARELGRKPAENIRRACEALGAVIQKSSADMCAVFPFLPRFPVTLQIWLADDEMEGTGQMTLQGRADHYLSAEDAVTAGDMLLNFVISQYALMFS